MVDSWRKGFGQVQQDYLKEKRLVHSRVASCYVTEHETTTPRHGQDPPKTARTARTSATVTALSPSTSYSQPAPAPELRKDGKHVGHRHRPILVHIFCTKLWFFLVWVDDAVAVVVVSCSGARCPRVHGAVCSLQSPSKVTVPAGRHCHRSTWQKTGHSHRHRCRSKRPCPVAASVVERRGRVVVQASGFMHPPNWGSPEHRHSGTPQCRSSRHQTKSSR